MIRAKAAMEKVIHLSREGWMKKLLLPTLLDIGAGHKEHARLFQTEGFKVTTLDKHWDADIQGDFLDGYTGEWDFVWASHVLEHSHSPIEFLRQCWNNCTMGGFLAVTVPPLKHQIVGGHVTLWNEGLLLYNAVLAGWDCLHAMVYAEGYDISLVVQKSNNDHLMLTLERLADDHGDIERLAPYFPIVVKEGFNGQLGRINWK